MKKKKKKKNVNNNKSREFKKKNKILSYGIISFQTSRCDFLEFILNLRISSILISILNLCSRSMPAENIIKFKLSDV